METILNFFEGLTNYLPVREVQTTIREIETMDLDFGILASHTDSLAGRNFVRLGGLSGGLAVIASAYGAHTYNHESENQRLKAVFESGNKMHLIHSLALLSMPLTKSPTLIGCTMATGMLIFSGSCYYQSITGDGRIRKITPYGGMLLILSWFLMIL